MFIDNKAGDADLPWTTAAEALAAMALVVGSAKKAQEALIKRAGADLVATRCARMRITQFGTGTTRLYDAKRISFEFWQTFEKEDHRKTEDWALGDFEAFFSKGSYQDHYYVAAYSVEIAFEAPLPQAGIAAKAPEPAAPLPPQNLGGRPRKGWWDDLWIEMIRRIQAGKLNPTSATQLEGIMDDWLTSQGFSPGDSTTKPSAAKLFKYLQEKRG